MSAWPDVPRIPASAGALTIDSSQILNNTGYTGGIGLESNPTSLIVPPLALSA